MKMDEDGLRQTKTDKDRRRRGEKKEGDRATYQDNPIPKKPKQRIGAPKYHPVGCKVHSMFAYLCL
jgi:hypothetical protein